MEADLRAKPCTPVIPVTFNSSGGDMQDFRYFFNAESSIKPERHYANRARIHLLELVEELVDDYELFQTILGKAKYFFDRHARCSAAFLLRHPVARIIDQDMTHHLGRDRKKMGAALPIRAADPDQAHVRFVHERCRLQRMAGPLGT